MNCLKGYLRKQESEKETVECIQRSSQKSEKESFIRKINKKRRFFSGKKIKPRKYKKNVIIKTR